MVHSEIYNRKENKLISSVVSGIFYVLLTTVIACHCPAQCLHGLQYVPLIDGIGFDPRNVTLNVAGETVTVSASTVLE